MPASCVLQLNFDCFEYKTLKANSLLNSETLFSRSSWIFFLV